MPDVKGRGKTLYVVWMDVDPDIVDEWNRWYEGVHLPEVVKKGGFLSARRFEVKEGDALGTFVTIYEASDRDHLKRYMEGPAGKLRKDYQDRYGSKSRVSRMVLEELSAFGSQSAGD